MIYDFPLNEKSRTYLRLESLFSQIRDNLESDQSWAHIAFFKGLFDLQELLERGDLRADLIKDLERLGQRLSHWASLPDVDLEQIHEAAGVDVAAGLADAAGLGRDAALPVGTGAVERLGQDTRHRGLAHASVATERSHCVSTSRSRHPHQLVKNRLLIIA
jgi:hypothetical protein